MLVHDIRKNETRVIDFRETAPSAIHEEMLQTNLDHIVWHFSGVPFNLIIVMYQYNICTLFLLHFSLVCW